MIKENKLMKEEVILTSLVTIIEIPSKDFNYIVFKDKKWFSEDSFNQGQLSAKEEEVKFLETFTNSRLIQNRLNDLIGQINKIKESLK